MPVDVQTLHMVRCRFELPALLRRVGADAISRQQFDLGYLVHWQLVSLFGDCAPSTFAIRGEEGRWVDVLAYAECDAEALRAASHAADPSAASACDWTGFGTKPMPATWRSGARLGFEVRVCPVVRRAKAGPRGRRGAEVDAFLAACDAAGDVPVDRMKVYRDWLERELARDKAALLDRFDPAGFRRIRLYRRMQGGARQGHFLERPELSAIGTMSIGQSEAFSQLLRRGIGRHRAFGFGMLLLRPER